MWENTSAYVRVGTRMYAKKRRICTRMYTYVRELIMRCIVSAAL